MLLDKLLPWSREQPGILFYRYRRLNKNYSTTLPVICIDSQCNYSTYVAAVLLA
jgi:hypothetical protein